MRLVLVVIKLMLNSFLKCGISFQNKIGLFTESYSTASCYRIRIVIDIIIICVRYSCFVFA